jgi:hypothetical protein
MVAEVFAFVRYLLRSVDWWEVTDVSGQPIGPIFKVQAVPKRL